MDKILPSTEKKTDIYYIRHPINTVHSYDEKYHPKKKTVSQVVIISFNTVNTRMFFYERKRSEFTSLRYVIKEDFHFLCSTQK